MEPFKDLEAWEPSQYLSTFTEYVEAYHSQRVVEVLLELDCADTAHYALEVSAAHLLARHLWLGTMLLSHTPELITLCDDAVREAQRRILAVHPDSTFMTFKPSVHTRLYNLPQCSELQKQTVSAIRTADSDRILQVPGSVIRTGQVKMLHLERQYECTRCAVRFRCYAELEQRHQMTLPPECTADGPGGKVCGGTKFELVEGSEKCHDYQELRIQEQVHRLSVGSIPRSITVLLLDDLVDCCKAGDDVDIVGILRKRWRPVTRGGRPEVELVIYALNICVNNEQRSVVHVSRELRLEFDGFWQKFKDLPLRGRDVLVASSCPSLAGMYLPKLALLLTLLGGVSFTDERGMRVRGESHMLLVGDAGTGKSQLLRHAASLSPRSVLTTGIGATSAGLTCTAVKDPGGEWMLEAGALVLADGGVCAVDEFDSIREHDRGAIHEAMEQQTLSVAKAGLVCKLRTRCSVFAACKPKGNFIDESLPLHISTGLPSPLLSRFDVALVLRDTNEPARDADLAAFIFGELDADVCNELRSVEWMRSYIDFSKETFKPLLTKASQTVLGAYYSLQRQDGGHLEARTTIRMLESSVRLAQAHARLMFRNEVLLVDAVYSIVLMEASAGARARVCGPISSLSSVASVSPDMEYPDLEKMILMKLGLDPNGLHDGNSIGNCEGGAHCTSSNSPPAGNDLASLPYVDQFTHQSTPIPIELGPEDDLLDGFDDI